MRIKMIHYDANRRTLMFECMDYKDDFELSIKEYIKRGNKVELISKYSGRRVKFTNTLGIIIDNHLSYMTGIPDFSRIKYKQIISEAKKVIDETKDNFYDAYDCLEYVFANFGISLEKVKDILMADTDYFKMLEYATNKIYN